MSEVGRSEVTVPYNDHEALARWYRDSALRLYAIPTITFPEGMPEQVHRFRYIVNERDEVLPDPRVSQIEFMKLMELLSRPTFDCLDLVLNFRILSATTPNPVTGCWERSATSNTGYGQVRNAGKGVKGVVAHRIFWQDIVGNINGISLRAEPLDVLDHRCLNKACCYPRHLRLTDTAGNNEAARLDKLHQVQARLILQYLFDDPVSSLVL
jgi:hypothetical protein